MIGGQYKRLDDPRRRLPYHRAQERRLRGDAALPGERGAGRRPLESLDLTRSREGASSPALFAALCVFAALREIISEERLRRAHVRLAEEGLSRTFGGNSAPGRRSLEPIDIRLMF